MFNLTRYVNSSSHGPLNQPHRRKLAGCRLLAAFAICAGLVACADGTADETGGEFGSALPDPYPNTNTGTGTGANTSTHTGVNSGTSTGTNTATAAGTSNIIPTTCDETHGYAGCCGPDGNLYFWGGWGVKSHECNGSCGWSAIGDWYECDTDGEAEPSGVFAYECGLPNPIPVDCSTEPSTGTGSGSATGTGTGTGTGSGTTNIIPTNCEEAHGLTGCCGPDGHLYYWGTWGMQNVDCAGTCGWGDPEDWYKCNSTGGPDPSGVYPYECGLPNPVPSDCP
jgi:hypothetical protein